MVQEQVPISQQTQIPMEKHSIQKLLKVIVCLLLLIAITSFAALYFKNYSFLSKTYQSIYNTSALNPYLTLLFQKDGGGNLVLLNATEVQMSRPGQILKPDNGYVVEVKKEGQSEFLTHMNSDFALLSVTVPKIPGSEIQLTDINLPTSSLTLKTDEISASASREITSKPAKIKVVVQAFKSTVSQIKERILSVIKRKDSQNLNPIPQEAQSLVAGIEEPKIISANSEKVVWYYPQTQEFVVVVLISDLEGVRQRTYEWLRAYGVKDQNSAKITFTQSLPRAQ